MKHYLRVCSPTLHTRLDLQLSWVCTGGQHVQAHRTCGDGPQSGGATVTYSMRCAVPRYTRNKIMWVWL